MLNIEIIAVSRMRNNMFSDLISQYQSRITWTLRVHEIESKHKDSQKANDDENSKILQRLNKSAVVIALDERGKTLKSIAFSKTLNDFNDQGRRDIQFVIGGANGLSHDIHQRADIILSFGAQTWPHLLARVMLLEQIYRAQQIIAGHPYHREG